VCLVVGWNLLFMLFCGVIVYVIMCNVVDWNLLCGILLTVVCICSCMFGSRHEFVVCDIVGCSVYK
jgi:hypothetical protein